MSFPPTPNIKCMDLRGIEHVTTLPYCRNIYALGYFTRRIAGKCMYKSLKMI